MGVCNSAKATGDQKDINANNPENKNDQNQENNNDKIIIQPPKKEEKKEEEKKEEEKKEEEKKEEEKKEEEKKEEEKNEPKDNDIYKEEGEYFARTMNLNQTRNLHYFKASYPIEGEDIVISFGDTFKNLDSFFSILSQEHELETNNPKYNYSKFFTFDGVEKYFPRALAIHVPYEQNEIYENNKSIYKENVIFKGESSTDNFKTMNDQFFASLGNRELNSDFISEFNNDSFINGVTNMLRYESEKCNSLRTIHLLGNIFNGISIGSLCSFLYEIQNDYKSSLKIAHLNYFDSYCHRAFTKIKNYIFGVSHLYDHCNMINFFNNYNNVGDILANLTAGERITEYKEKYNLNRIMSDILINPNANFVYCNGCRFEKKDYLDFYTEYLYEDCKEGKNHLDYRMQLSSLCIYKGNLYCNDDQKKLLSNKMAKVVDYRLNNNRAFYNFYNIDRTFKYDYVSNIHQTEYFKVVTEEYLMNFRQNYNIDNFTKEEKDGMREDSIYKVNNILNEYKEIWRLIR